MKYVQISRLYTYKPLLKHYSQLPINCYLPGCEVVSFVHMPKLRRNLLFTFLGYWIEDGKRSYHPKFVYISTKYIALQPKKYNLHKHCLENLKSRPSLTVRCYVRTLTLEWRSRCNARPIWLHTPLASLHHTELYVFKSTITKFKALRSGQ